MKVDLRLHQGLTSLSIPISLHCDGWEPGPLSLHGEHNTKHLTDMASYHIIKYVKAPASEEWK